MTVLLAASLIGCQPVQVTVSPETPGESSVHELQPEIMTPHKTLEPKAPSATWTVEGLAAQASATVTLEKPRSDQAKPTVTVEPTISPTMEPTATITRAPGEMQVSALDGMVQVYIPGGDFLMGSDDADPGADGDEKPQHQVTLDSFWIDQTVVTNQMYARFLNEMGNQVDNRSTWLDAGDEDVLIILEQGVWKTKQGFEMYPAIEVTWFGARAYCAWAGRRLPTEAEWERAARGDTGWIYPWGNEIDCEKAQYANCGGGLLPVGSKPKGASPYGVLGLSGNVWEWVADGYAVDYYAFSPADNPTGPIESDTRVLRGSSWEYDWKHLRAANRRHNGPAASMHDYGFRCGMDTQSAAAP